jgi:hypothetical protein
MNIKLTHSFLLTAYDVDALLKDCNLLSTFCNRLVKQSEQHPDRQDPLKYRGDAFELFTEALIKLSPIDNRIGIYDYQNAPPDCPGVDGFGKGSNGKPATVQCKFVSKHDDVLTATGNLSNFVNQSFLKFSVDVQDTQNLLVVTTAKGLHHYTDTTMFDGKVRCLGHEELRAIVDNNFAFWDQFRQLVKTVN